MTRTIYNYKIYLSIIFFLLMFFQKSIGQPCYLKYNLGTLGGNNMKASIAFNGNLFWFPGLDNTFQNTTPSIAPHPSTIFANGIWIAAKNDFGSLKLAAATYTNGASYDFVAGPINNDNGQITFDCENYNQYWEVYDFEINTHLDDFSDNGIINNPISNIYAYPGNQNPYFENIHGFALPNTPQGLAPFFDENSDGIYNPDDGDYPLPEAVNPNQIPSHLIWGIFNDGGTEHTASYSDPLNVEVQQTVWSFYCDDNDLLNNTIFTSHKIINRSNDTLNSMIVSNWTDFDNGCITDDLIGSIPDMNTYYSYNEDSIDGTNGIECLYDIPSYGDNPPVQSITFLNRNMSAFGTPTNANFHDIETSDPYQPIEYYNYMNGLWRDGTEYTVGGSGYGGTEVTKFLYYDNPNNPDGWSMFTGNFFTADRRCVASTEIDGSFAPGDVVNIDMAYTYYQDENLNHVETVNLVYDNTPTLQQMYNDGFAASCNSYEICMDDCVYTGDADKDSVVTSFDFLQIGLGYNKTGTERTHPKNWYPFDSQNWSNNINGTNLKHTDCSGNAIIDSADFYFVEQHLGFSYKISPFIDQYNYGPELTVESFSPATQIENLQVGEVGYAKIDLNVNEDLFGIAFMLEIDNEFLSVTQPLHYSPWNSGVSDFYKFINFYNPEGEIYYTYVKLDGENSSADDGILIRCAIEAKDNNYELVETPIRIKNIRAVLADGTLLDYGSQDFVVTIENPNGSGTILNNKNLEEADIQLFPNPTYNLLHIKMTERPSHLSIFDIYGKRVLEKTSGFENEMQLSIDHFSAGVYFVKIKMGEKDFVKKIIKH